MSKVVLITGASSGIGKTIAEFLTLNNFKVFGTCRNPENYSSISFELIKCDILNNKDINTTVDYILNKEKKIDVLINNVGIGITGPIEEAKQEDIIQTFKTNCFGPLEITKKCIHNKVNWIKIFNTHSKKDDLADCYLQAISYIINSLNLKLNDIVLS